MKNMKQERKFFTKNNEIQDTYRYFQRIDCLYPSKLVRGRDRSLHPFQGCFERKSLSGMFSATMEVKLTRK